jgi:hypothetical protein
MLFAAESGDNNFWNIVAIIVATLLQSWWTAWRDKIKAAKDAKDKEAAEVLAKKSVAATVALVKKTNEVHTAVNGTGILGQLRRINEWQTQHEAVDTQRHEENTDRICKIMNAVGIKEQAKQEEGEQ